MKEIQFKNMERNSLKDALIGMVVGDALGLPYMGMERKHLQKEPVSDFVVNEARWSADTTLAIALTEALMYNLDKKIIKQLFSQIVNGEYWALVQPLQMLDENIIKNLTKTASGKANKEFEKGTKILDNTTLLQIIPLSVFVVNMPINLRVTLVQQVVSFTNPYNKAFLSALYLEEFLRNFLQGDSLLSSYFTVQETLPLIWRNINMDLNEIEQIWRLMSSEIWAVPVQEIHTGQDIVDTLEAAMWVIMKSRSYVDAVLTAVNLGGDTATLGALVGGIAGIVFSYDNIPRDWIDKIYLVEQIERSLDKIFEENL